MEYGWNMYICMYVYIYMYIHKYIYIYIILNVYACSQYKLTGNHWLYVHILYWKVLLRKILGCPVRSASNNLKPMVGCKGESRDKIDLKIFVGHQWYKKIPMFASWTAYSTVWGPLITSWFINPSKYCYLRTIKWSWSYKPNTLLLFGCPTL